MPRNVNPASISVGAGIAPQGTVEDNSLRYPQRDTDSLRAHLLDPNNAHMASAIGIVDAGGYYASTDVEGALQELGGGGAAGRHNGLVLGGTFTSGPGLLTLDTPTEVLIGGVLASFGGATVVLPPSVTRYVWIDPTTYTLTATAGLPAVSTEPILIAKVTTDAGANVTSSQDARFFVANLDRKLDYSLRSDGTAVNDAAEACFVTLDAALFWLENYVATGQESKTVIIVRGSHTISSTVVLPAGVPNIEFRGESGATFVTGAVLSPMFDVSGAVGATFTNLVFQCDHAGSDAITTTTALLPCSNVTVQRCVFSSGAGVWAQNVVLTQGAPAAQTGHRLLDSQFTASFECVRITHAVRCVVRDCDMTGSGAPASYGLYLQRTAGVGEGCLVDNVSATGFSFPLVVTADNTTLRRCTSFGGVGFAGGSVVGGVGVVVTGCNFAGTDSGATAGLRVLSTAVGAVVSDTSVTSTAVWALGNPAGILVEADGVVVTGCTISGFYNAAGSNGAGVRVSGTLNNKVTDTDISNCYTGVDVTVAATGVSVAGCTISAKVQGIAAASTTSNVRVTDSTVLLDAVTGIAGVVVLGGDSSVRGCKIATARAFNTYAPGELPAGVLCGTTGPYLLEGCTFTNFYDSTNHTGGGVCAGDVTRVVVSGCSFMDGGVNLDGTTTENVLVTGCTFYTGAPALRHLGVKVETDTLQDLNVSDCLFKFNSDDTFYGVDVSASVGLNRVVVANCTYTNTVAPGGVEAFVRITTGLGENVLIEGNSVSYPTAHTSGCLLIEGVGSLTLTGNSIMSDTPATAGVAARVQAKTVVCANNTFVGLNGLTLVGVGGLLPTLQASGNIFDGADDTAMVAVSLFSVGGAPVTAYNSMLTGNVFMNCLTAVDFTTTGTLTLQGLTFTGNTVSACRQGFVTDADTADTLSVSSNTFSIYDYAFFYNKATATYTNGVVDGNTVTQAGFVGPAAPTLGLITLFGADVANLSVSGNTLDHEGSVRGVSLVLTGAGARDIAIDGNTVRNENATGGYPVAVQLSSTTVGSPQINNVSVSRNTVRHFGNSYDAIYLDLSGSLVANVFRNIRMDDNSVTVEEDNPSNAGVVLRVSGGAGFPLVRNVSMSRNEVSAFGPSVRLRAWDMGRVENVALCDNTAVAGNASSLGAIYFNCGYTAAGGPATALVDGLIVSRNTVKYSASNFAVRVESVAPATNLSVDENSVVQVGDPANPVPNTANIYLSLLNTSAFGTRNAATGVSVSRNKVSGVSPNQGEAAVLLDTPGGLVTQGENITVDGNEVYNHVGAAIKVQFGYTSIQNLSVSGNVVRNVEGSAIRVSNTAVYGLNVSNNLIHEALTAGVAGNATIGVNLDAGEGFVFSGNRLGSTSYKGISISGAATATLDAVTFTGNSVSFSGGASPEEGLAVFWPNRLAALTLSGNVVQGAAVGMCIEGGLPTSVAGPLPSLVRGVAITANSVSASNGGVRVSNTTTDSGVGTASLEDVQVSGNTLTADSATLAMVYGVQVDTIFGTLEKVTVTGNTIDMGSSSTGDGVLIDANDAAPSQVSVSDNSTLNGDHGVYVLGNGTATFSGITVCRNRVSSLDTDGILLSGMTALRSVTVDGNTVEDTGARGVSIFSSDIQQDSRNVSVSGNSVNSTEGAGIRVQLYTSAASPTMHNLSVCHNKVSNWNDGTAAAVLTSAIRIALCNDVLKPHPLKNLNVSHNLCENVDAANDWVQGFDFSLDEETRQVVFAHNQVLLGNQTNAGAMHWTFINTGGPVPKDFTFTGNQFCDTNSVAPSFTAGLPGDFATFYGNIGSALNFWTTFATNWATYVPNGAISTHNIDDGT